MTAIANKDAAYIRELEARLWRSVETAKQAAARIEALEARNRNLEEQRDAHAKKAMALEAALREIADPYGDGHVLCQEIARAALAPEPDK